MQNLSQNGCSVWVTSSTELALKPTAVALGKFDGVHRGHQRVIQPILPDDSSASPEHVYSTLVTFNPHPQEFFTGEPRTLLTPLDEKVEQLRLLGVEQLVLLSFDTELCALTPEAFVQKIIVEQLQATQVSVGQDFRFGSRRSGTAEDLQTLAAKYDIPVTVVPLQTYRHDAPDNTPDERISTSLIRQILEIGDLERANRLLGRCYSLSGMVIQGQQLGRTIGFPTANLQLPKDKFLPHRGVYAVRVHSYDRDRRAIARCDGVMNIGDRPTVNGIKLSVEVHLLDWSGDLYGRKLTVELVQFLRSEQKFPSLEALKTQINLDCIAAKTFLRER